jgi:hypothetical protein
LASPRRTWLNGPYLIGVALRLALILAVLGVVALVPTTGWAQGAAAPPETPEHIWLDEEGEPLPMQSDAEVSEFLRTARVVSKQGIDVGVNRAERLLLEKDGARAHAIFRVVDIEERQVQVGPRFYQRFRDSYLNECAAHDLARWLGFDNVVGEYLDGAQVSALAKRRELLIEHVERLVAERSEAAVFY